LTVLYRHGYYANEAIAPFDRQRVITLSRISAAAAFEKAVPDIPIHVRASQPAGTGAPEVRLEVTIDPTPLAFTKASGRNVGTVELAAFCLDGKDSLLGEVWKSIQLSYTDDRLAAVKRDGITIPLGVPARAAAKNLKVIVYDYAADRVGSAVVKVQETK